MFRPEAVATVSDYPKLPKPLFNSSARYFERLAQAFEANGELAREIPGFSVREGQRALAYRIGQAIAAGEALIAEAGTGTGKTFAYLVPALLSGGPVVISTGTRNLQDQLFHRDLPRVRAALGVNLRVALLKGRANYVCRHHLRRNLQEGRFDRREDIAVARTVWVKTVPISPSASSLRLDRRPSRQMFWWSITICFALISPCVTRAWQIFYPAHAQ